MPTFINYAQNTSSEKTTLALVEMVGPAFGFTEVSTGVWTLNPDYPIVAVKTGTFTYNLITNLLTITQTTNPDGLIVTYGLRFTDTAGIDLSFDLTDSGDKVYYLPLLEKPEIGYRQSTGPQQNQYTQEGRLSIIDSDKDFINLVDSALYLFENQSAKIYSWNRELPPSEAQLIFEGNVITANIQDDSLELGLKDLTWQFKDEITFETYGDLVITDEKDRLIRKIYGLVNGLQIQSIDQIGEGQPLTGTSSIIIDDITVFGVNTFYLTEVAEGDTLVIDSVEYRVEEILSDTILVLADTPDVTLFTQTVNRKQSRPDYQYNRDFVVAGHQLKKFSTLITAVEQRNRFKVDSIDGFDVGDLISVNGVSVSVLRICSDIIVTDQNINTAMVGNTIDKLEVLNVAVEGLPISNRDIVSITNQDPFTSIKLDVNAEINATPEVVTPFQLQTYTNSRFASINRNTLNRLIFNGINKLGTSFSVTDEDLSTQVNVIFTFSDFVVDGSLQPLELTTAQINMRARVAGSIYEDTTLDVYKIDNGTSIVSLGANEPDFIELLLVGETNDSFAFKVWNYFTEERTYYVPILINGGIEVWSNDTSVYSIFQAGSSGFTVTRPFTGDGKFTRVTLTDLLEVKDLVKTNTVAQVGFNEIQVLNDKNFIFKNIATENTTLGALVYKKPNYLTDTKPITCSAYGKTVDGLSTGEWINTNPGIVKQELLEKFPNIRLNNDSFTRASIESPYLPGLKLPLGLEDRAPTIEDLINEVNDSCLGNLVLRNDFSIGYEIENADIDDIENIRIIRDTQVISDTLNIETEQSLLFTTKLGNIEINYNTLDFAADGQLTSLERVENEELKELIGIDITKEITVNLVRQSDVNLLAQQYLFLNTFNNTKLNFLADLSVSDLNVGDTVLLDMREIPERRGGYKKFLGKVRSIERNSATVNLIIDNVGSSMERGIIITNSDTDWSVSTVDERQLAGFISDVNGLIDNDKSTYGLNLIS